MTTETTVQEFLAQCFGKRERLPAHTEGAPVVAVCGWSGSGKTTLMVDLIQSLSGKGLRVAAVKHDAHALLLDHPGKDSDRFFAAGADVVAHDSAQTFTRRRNGEGFSLAQTLIGLAKEYDIVLVEGHKSTPLPKLWLEGPEDEAPPSEAEGILARLPWDAPRSERAERLVLDWLDAHKPERSRRQGFRLVSETSGAQCASQPAQSPQRPSGGETGADALIAAVRGQVQSRVTAAMVRLAIEGDTAALSPGKMLRSRLAARVAARASAPAAFDSLARACAATELVHTASLCHDDVVDDAAVRRKAPTLWKMAGASTAILVGDMLLCDALGLLAENPEDGVVAQFTVKVREVCEAEAEQELLSRGHRLETGDCLDMARRKTGPLFAFPAMSSVADAAAAKELEQAGYEIGAAYQLADDWLDVAGSEERSGKTLGSDARRDKFTLAQGDPREQEALHRHIVGLLRSALDRLAAWPDIREGVCDYLRLDLQPALARMHERLEEDLREAL